MGTSRGPTPVNPIMIAGRGRGAGLVRPPPSGGRGTTRRSSSGGNDMEKDILAAVGPSGGAILAALSNDEIKRDLVVDLFPFHFVDEFWNENEMGIRGAYGMLCGDLDKWSARRELILTCAKAPLFGSVRFRVKINERHGFLHLTKDGIKEVVNVTTTPSAFKVSYGNVMQPQRVVATSYMS